MAEITVKTVKPDELGWMLAQGWTLLDDGARTEEGKYRITNANSPTLSAAAKAAFLKLREPEEVK